MADERRIPYIIELGIKEESLRKQMSGWNWEEIIGIKDFCKHFKKTAKLHQQIKANLQNIL